MDLAKSVEVISDEQLILDYKNNDDRALGILISRYEHLVRAICNSFYLKRWDKEDLLQEGMIALIKAIKNYRPEKAEGKSFYSFAKKIIHLHMIGVLRKHTRMKHQVLNLAVPLEQDESEENNKGVIEFYPCANAVDPIDAIVEKENIEEINKYIRLNLTSLEADVLNLYLNNYSYKQIAKLLDINNKAVDNALARIKKKLKKVYLPK